MVSAVILAVLKAASLQQGYLNLFTLLCKTFSLGTVWMFELCFFFLF
jgi:hypothetical protein